MDTVEAALISYLADAYLDGEDEELTPETPLLELNILDSVEILGVVRFIHDRFGKSVSLTDIVPENFSTVRRIRDLVVAEKEGSL
ncbi:acyl carrier protein [[Pseudopropionibacterium] massiliense]|uniref:acyl carrier protein n=1 Tax=[Pseudopropionibacterium] massiliense TaxID=2220000 RepID=UPI0013EEF35D|nr:phosphopantetheine-binding protein [[Pseudopropionibacterium] massiliense]